MPSSFPAAGFYRRAGRLLAAWAGGEAAARDTAALLLMAGDGGAETQPTLQDRALAFLFGEAPITNTAVLLRRDAVLVVTSRTKHKHYASLAAGDPAGAVPTAEFLNRKDGEALRAVVQGLAGGTVGRPSGPQPTGAMPTLWCEAGGDALARVEVDAVLSAGTAAKDEAAVAKLGAAAAAAEALVGEVHAALAKLYAMDDTSTVAKLRGLVQETLAKRGETEKGIALMCAPRRAAPAPPAMCSCPPSSYPPRFDDSALLGALLPRDAALRRTMAEERAKLGEAAAAEHTDAPLLLRALVCAVGVMRHGLFANTVRTLLFEPSKAMSMHHATLVHTADAAAAAVWAGATGADVYRAAEEHLRRVNPHLLPHLTKTVGHSMGHQFKEGLSLSARCDVALVPGQVLNLQLALVGIPAEGTGARYTLAVGDTVVVPPDSRLVPKAKRRATVLGTGALRAAHEVQPMRRGPLQNLRLPMEVLDQIFSHLDAISLGRVRHRPRAPSAAQLKSFAGGAGVPHLVAGAMAPP